MADPDDEGNHKLPLPSSPVQGCLACHLFPGLLHISLELQHCIAPPLILLVDSCIGGSSHCCGACSLKGETLCSSSLAVLSSSATTAEMGAGRMWGSMGQVMSRVHTYAHILNMLLIASHDMCKKEACLILSMLHRAVSLQAAS